MTLKPGEHIWWHYHTRNWKPGMPHWLDPMTVVRDDAQSLVAWLAPGTVVLKTVLDTGEDVRAAPLPERYNRKLSMAKTLWRGEGILRIAPIGVPWSVWLFWEPGWQFAGWYVNQAAAITRSADVAEVAVASWKSPFGNGWEDWRPDPRWKMPALPDGASRDFDLTPTHP